MYRKCPNEYTIDIALKNEILTPLTCAAIVTEFIKNLIYQKAQIPYPFSWLKSTVNQRKETILEPRKYKNTIEQNFKVAFEAFDFLNNLSRQIHNEFKCNFKYINSFYISFGTTPTMVTELYVLRIPKFVNEHSEESHLNTMDKRVNKILRQIMLTENWHEATQKNLPLTNMFIFISKQQCEDMKTNDFFLPKNIVRISPLQSHIRINMSCFTTEKIRCCNNLDIFEDQSDLEKAENKSLSSVCQIVNSEKMNETDSVSDSEFDCRLYQAKIVFKGFKDVFIDKQSVSTLW